LKTHSDISHLDLCLEINEFFRKAVIGIKFNQKHGADEIYKSENNLFVEDSLLVGLTSYISISECVEKAKERCATLLFELFVDSDRKYYECDVSLFEKLFLTHYRLQFYSQILDESVETTGDEESKLPQSIDDIIVNSLIQIIQLWKEYYPKSLVVISWNLPGSNPTSKSMVKTFKEKHGELIEKCDLSFFQEFATGENGACDAFVKRFDKEFFAIQNLKRFNKKSDDFGVIMWSEKYSLIEKEFGFQGMRSINPTMINVHLSNTITREREEELEELFNYISSKLKRKSFVCAGDWNTELNLEKIHSISHFSSIDQSKQRTTKSGRKIDHILFSDDFQCKLCVVPEILAFSESNHFPKIAFLKEVDDSDSENEVNEEEIDEIISNFSKKTVL
ncbi:predicted protein, partial [Naegleria gruberi]